MMRIYTPQNDELMHITSVKRAGPCLLLKGKIMQTMPLSAEVRPEEIRKFLKMLSFKELFFLLTMVFRKSVN
ncbi:MAG: hypothetical protein COB36_11280 [Alphaproteobacteria bacterium]|nr:MAG: hypothetical protein COB36_11280 [Alphaproteobacteria bacterium]